MPRQLGLPAALAGRGLTVEVVPGWETRGDPVFNPGGALCHWTAGPRTGDRPSLAICVNGRVDRLSGRVDLPGPLCNVFLTRAGVAIVVASGRANHAGAGGWRGLVGNSAVFGTEAESSGNGDWTAAQRAAYPRVNAAYADLAGFGAEMVAGHHEWAPTRKIDIRDWPMSAMRDEVARLIATREQNAVDTARSANVDIIIFQHNGAIYAAYPKQGTYQHVPNEKTLHDMTQTVWPAAKLEVREWKDLMKAKTNNVQNIAAFGVRIR